jgi:hypothetical protein
MRSSRMWSKVSIGCLLLALAQLALCGALQAEPLAPEPVLRDLSRQRIFSFFHILGAALLASLLRMRSATPAGAPSRRATTWLLLPLSISAAAWLAMALRHLAGATALYDALNLCWALLSMAGAVSGITAPLVVLLPTLWRAPPADPLEAEQLREVRSLAWLLWLWSGLFAFVAGVSGLSG